jgi:hypothetical protein
MKKTHIDSFLLAIKNSMAYVVMHDDDCEVISFSGFSSTDKFRLFIEEKKKMADICYLNAIAGGIQKIIYYHNCLVVQVDDEFSLYDDINGIIHYKKLIIIDENENIHKFQELPLAAQQKISSFLSIQYDALICFYSMLNHSDVSEIFVPINGNEDLLLPNFPDAINSLDEPKPQSPDDKLAEGDRWIDNQDACLTLNVSKRTLRRYRENNILSYTRIGNKFHYKYFDVLRLLNKKYNSTIQ